MLDKLVLGTYLGLEDNETDRKIISVLAAAYNSGVYWFDTAPNYRNMRSEKCIGYFIEQNNIARASLVIGTKGGFIPYDFSNTSDENENDFLAKLAYELNISINDVDAYYFHCLHPYYLEYEFKRSLKRLQSEYIDVYYLHNPEYLLRKIGVDEFYLKIEKAFEWIKTEIRNDKIKSFGISVWDGLFSDESVNIQLSKLNDIANKLGIADEFKWLQFPFNILENRAFFCKTQEIDGVLNSTVKAANKLGIQCITSACFGQGRIERIKITIDQAILPGDNIYTQALNYAFTAPGISNLILGTTNIDNLTKNLNDISKLDDRSQYFANVITG